MKQLQFTEIETPGFERVIEICADGLHVIVAIHDTTLGPALGGLRVHPYASRIDALEDVLRLAEGMTYKSASLDARFGGGKSVMIADPTCKSKALLKGYADILNALDGQYLGGKDVGITSEELEYVRQYTPHVAGATGSNTSGDPCPYTAWGVLRGTQAAAKWLWNDASLCGRRVAIQGLGGVGMRLAELLFWLGAELVVSDIDPAKTGLAARRFGAQVAEGDAIFNADVDIFAPCALGGILNVETIDDLRCQAVIGGANNQLASDADGERLHKRGILYAPDFVANGGGLLNGAAEFAPGGYDPVAVRAQVDRIGEILFTIYETADRENRPTSQVALDLARQRLASAMAT